MTRSLYFSSYQRFKAVPCAKISIHSRDVYKCSFKWFGNACGKLDKRELLRAWLVGSNSFLEANRRHIYYLVPDFTSACSFSKYTENRDLGDIHTFLKIHIEQNSTFHGVGCLHCLTTNTEQEK